MLPRVVGCRPGGTTVVGTKPSSLGAAIEELDEPPQAVEVKEVFGPRLGRVLRRWGGVRAAQGNRGVSSIRKPDDEVRIAAAAQANDLDTLTAEGVMGMGDGDESRRRRG